MNYLDEIIQYQPINQQETEDKKNILKYINIYGNQLLYRENTIAHFTASSFIINKDHNKTLMIYHKLRNTWAWTGGHLDKNETFLEAAIRESKEELGINTLPIKSKQIFSIDILPVDGHVRKGKYVSSHLHLSISYVFELNEKEKLNINRNEAANVRWIQFEEINKDLFNELDIFLYQKLIGKVNNQL